MKMKKLKRLLAGVMTAAMVMSTMAMTAFADEAKKPTIDTTKKGSITINKYEGEDTSKPLAGVTFKIYKVADLNQKADPVELEFKPTVAGISSITADTTYGDIKDAVDAAISDGALTAAKTGTTALNEAKDKASVKFEGLDLGVYLVVETEAPSQIVNKSANFLVSVPMTNTDGDDWVYDIVANPKNDAVYGGISLIKRGITLKTDGTQTTTNLVNVTFVLQEKQNGTWKTVNEVTTDVNGSISATDLAPGEYRFVETSLGGTEDNKGYILNGEEYKFTVNEEGKIVIGRNAPTDSGVIYADNEKPEFEKTVENKEGSFDNDTDASVGDYVTWKVTAAVPSNVDQLATYKITDKMSNGLTWVEDKANLTVITNVNGVALVENTDYTLTKPNDNTSGGTWTITFTQSGKEKLAENNVKYITVTFDTLLNENANVGNTGNLNDAQLDYSNAIYPTIDGENPNNGKTPGEDHIKDEAIVYTFGIDVLKVDGKTSNALAGVKFDLYKYNGTEANPTVADLKGSDGKLVKGELTTDANGKISVSGLENGTYYLVETQTNSGYNLLKEPVKVVVNVAYTVKTETTVVKDKNGNVTSTTTVTTKTFTGGKDNSGRYEITVKNNKGFELPTTGGFGTILFSVIGILLMAGGAVVLFRTNKKKTA